MTAMVNAARAAADVRVMPFNRNPSVLEATKRAVQRAGYDAELLLGP